MKKILFYISDHGYGHATRIIAIVQDLLEKEKNLKIYIRAFFTYDFLKHSFSSDKVSLYKIRNDFGVIYKRDGYSIDQEETLNSLRAWIENKDLYLEGEKKFCQEKGINLIISDIPPFVFEVGQALSIPTIAVSNFNWYRIYKEFAKSREDLLLIEEIKKLYQKANYSFILPFHCGEMDIFKNKEEFSLVVRKFSLDKEEVFKRLEIDQGQRLIYVSFGFSIFNEEFIKNLEDLRLEKKITLLLSTRDLVKKNKNIISIPKDSHGSHNYIGLCDLAVCKVGFSTVSECMTKNIPLVLLKREGFVEDEFTLSTLKKIKIAEEISLEDYVNFNWLKDIDKYLSLKTNYQDLPSSFKTTGASDIGDRILEILR
ncbi:hypothetical protein KKB84_04120 [bacterium]|nr:hypothetical protein [bacterium]